MTLCTKQFDPLKKCIKRSGEKVDCLKINFSNEKPIGAYEAAQINNPRYLGDHYLGDHYSCGHYWRHHRDIPDDLINVEEEISEETLKQLNQKLIEVKQLCVEAIKKILSLQHEFIYK